MLATLDENNGRYDAQSIVLQNTSTVRAEVLAKQFGAKLRITSDGSYATLALPEGLTIRDICADPENRALIAELSIDYHASISDLAMNYDTDAGQTPISVAPRYTVTDDGYSLQTYLDYLNLDTTWSITKGNSVTVAIIDSGIDTDHPEFSGRISAYSYNATEDKVIKDYIGADGSYDYSLIEDTQGHGTAVAGVVAAGMNGSGTVGIAPSAELLIIKAECDEAGNFARSSDLVFGLYYAIERGADIVNMSFGVIAPDDPFQDGAQLAYDSDIICVAAAGNDSTTTLTYPAANKLVIGVGALGESSWELANYSNYGSNTDLVAPGTVYTTRLGGSFGYMSGTSFAAPAVAGTLALYLDQKQYAASYDVLETIAASCRDLGSPGRDWLYGYGAVDASALILEEKGIVTFQMQCEELEDTTQVFVRNHTLQNIPEPERNYAVFDGWYYDPQCTEAYEWYTDEFSNDLTLYAKWANEDDAVPFTYVTLDDSSVEIRSYTGHRRYITIPDYIGGKKVTSIGNKAFLEEDQLRLVYLPDTLVSIGQSAFEGCANLAEIAIPDSVETIGHRAFYANTRLGTVSLGDNSNLSVIGDYAFAHCSNLARFEIPASLDSMNGSALFGTTRMTIITVRGGNEYFAAKEGVLFSKSGTNLIAFPAGIRGNYVIPSSVRNVDSFAFGYAAITSIDLNQTESIGSSAFSHSSLEAVVIPDTVVSIASDIFEYNYALRNVTLSASLHSIPDRAFYSCTALVSIEIPANVESIDPFAFSSCTNLSVLTFAEGSALTDIRRNAFSSTDLRQVALPASLMHIGDEAFSNLSHLIAVQFESDSELRKIGTSAFSNAVTLTSIKLPEKLQFIMSYAFQGSGLTSVTIPAATTQLGAGSFASCHHLTAIAVSEGSGSYVSVNGVVYNKEQSSLIAYPAGASETVFTIPSTVTTIAPAAFYGSHNLHRVSIADSVATIAEKAFYDCQNVTQYTLPDSLITIGAYAFSRNRALTAFAIPDSTEQIGRFAFAEDYNLGSITIRANTALNQLSYGVFAYTGIDSFRVPASISTMAQGVFEGCTSLTSITFEANSQLDSIPAYLFDGSENLEYITFEAGSALTTIQANGFANLQNLITVNFGDAKITQIGNYAFKSCKMIQEIAFPDSLENIGRFAFYNCESLTALTIPSRVEHIGSYAFYGAENLNLYFSADFLPLYLDENWDSGIAGYHAGVQNVSTAGDWRYATLNSGNLSIIEYLGNASVIDMSTLNLGGSITSIGGRAFENATITSITLPDSLINIQSYAFAGSNLQNIVIPASVIFIGRNAFSDTPVTGLTFDASSQIRIIEQEAFANTAQLTTVTLPQSLTTLGPRVFFQSGLRNLTFADGIQLAAIPRQAFAFSNLRSVTIPDSVTEINSGAFRDCRELISMTLGMGEDLYIADHAFYNTGLTDVYIPENVSYLGECAFVGLESLEAFQVSADNFWYTEKDGLLMSADGRKLIAVPAGRSGSLTVPASVEELGFGAFERSTLSSVEFAPGTNILTLGYRAFYSAKNLKHIELPASVISISYYAFAECPALESVIFAEDSRLTGIYEGAFYNCSNLRDIMLPDTVMEISDFSFYGCEALEFIPIGSDSQLLGIYDYAFAHSGITELTTPTNLSSIGSFAFMGIRATDVTISDNNLERLTIGIGAFSECNQLEQITIPFIGNCFASSDNNHFAYIFGAESVHSGKYVVPPSLKHVSITEGISEIPASAFMLLDDLETINIPHSVQRIGQLAFYGTVAVYELTNTIYLDPKIDGSDFGDGLSGHLTLGEGITELGEGFLHGKKHLTSVTLPDTITSIGPHAFRNCIALERIEIPSGVTVIPEHCFEYCYSLQEVILPDGVTTIGDHAFENCFSLHKCDLSDQLVTIGNYAFTNCRSLMHVEIPDNVTTVCEAAFRHSGMNSLILGRNLTSIGSDAFLAGYLFDVTNRSTLILTPQSTDNGAVTLYARVIRDAEGNPIHTSCNQDYAFIRTPEGFHFRMEDGLYYLCAYTGGEETVSLPDQINGSDYVIEKMVGVKNVIIPESFTRINAHAFEDCRTLKRVILPSRLRSIESNAFSCSGVSEIVFPDGLEKIGELAFFSCDNLAQIRIPGGVELDSHAFATCHSLKTVILDKGITSLEDTVFDSCISLETIILPSTLSSISENVFGSFDCLKSVIFSMGNPNFCIEDGLLYTQDRTRLILVLPSVTGEVVLPDTLTSIDPSAFQHRTKITSVILPDTLTAIEDETFTGCSELETITIPDGVTSLGTGAFRSCHNLRSVTLPEGITQIKSLTFFDCPALENVNIPDSVTEIESGAFMKCTSLQNISLPAGLTTLGEYAFCECGNLESITIPVGITEIRECTFQSCDSLRSVVIPEHVTAIRSFAFDTCKALSSIIIPDTVTSIGDSAFANCNGLQYASIGNGINIIPSNAFSSCDSLMEVSIGENVGQIEENAFMNCGNMVLVRNNSDLHLVFGSIDDGCLAQNAMWIVNRDGTERIHDDYSSVSLITDAHGFQYLCTDGEYTMVGYEGDSNTATLPLQVNGQPYTIRSIGTVEHLVIPNGHQQLQADAFYDNQFLKSLWIGKDVTPVQNCFANCDHLEEVTIEEGTKTIHPAVFRYCDDLHTIHLGAGLVEFYDDTFGETGYANNPDNWEGDMLICDGYLLDVKEDARYAEWKGMKNNAHSAYHNCELLEIAEIGPANRFAFSATGVMKTLILSHTPVTSVDEMFFEGIPSSLQNIVIRENVSIDSGDYFQGVTGINIFVEADREAAAIWDYQYPDWNNGNSVYYAGEWITATFFDIDGSVQSKSYQTQFDMIREPYYAVESDIAYDYTVIGWDLDGDGSADQIPPTSDVDIHAHPVVVRTPRKYTITYYDKDGSTVLYTQCVPYGETVTLPDAPEKTGYTFSGWLGYTDKMTVKEDTFFYAAWTHIGDGHVYGESVWYDATCTEQGHNRYTCTICGEWYATDPTPALGHHYQRTTVEAACGKEGYDQITCTVCASSYRENFTPSAPHKMSSWIIDESPSCSTEGSQHRSCTTCGMTETEVLSQTGHHCESTIITEPTCDSEGIRSCTCQVCGYAFLETIPTTQHQYVKQTVAPGVLEQLLASMPDMLCGYEGDTGYCYLCSACGKIQTHNTTGSIQGSVSGSNCTHTDAEWTTVTEQTCKTPHIQWRICQLCGMAVEARMIAPADPSLHNYIIEVTEPTCTERGFTVHTCHCGDSYVDTYVDALGHNMGAWFTGTEATCTENGVEQRACSRCDHSETRVMEATGHDYESVVTESTCTEGGYTTHTCHCGESYIDSYTDALGHDFTEWTVVHKPTEREEGLESRFCYRCGVEDTRTIPWLENPFTDVDASSFYYAPVMWAVENGITNGTSATTFGPNDQCMRAHVVTFLWRAVGCPEPTRTDNPFVDVKPSDFYYKPVMWAVENSITNGLDATHFGPFAYCNRAQVVTFLYRTMCSPESESTENPFTDVASGAFYEKPVLWAVDNGITNGLSATTFGPTTSCNRAQIVTFLYRAFVND